MFKNMESNLKEKIFLITIAILLSAAIIGLFDRTLAVGIIFIALLTGITFLVFKKIGFRTKTIFALFLIALSVYLGAVLFVYYAHFQPFSGGFGDYTEYDSLARDIVQRVHHGDFSLQGIGYETFYTVVIAYIYALILPEPLIGQMFNAWLVALLVIFVYLIVLEMGGSKKEGFFAGLMVSIYPSLLFFGSLLGKDAFAVLLFSITLFLILKVLKKFSWIKFLTLYISLIAITNVRIYVSCALILTFIICWFIFSGIKIKRRLIYGLVMIFLLGFLFNISGGQGVGAGYYGINFMKFFLNREMINYYRELVSIPNPKISPITGFPVYDEPVVSEPLVSESSVSEPLLSESSVSEPSAPTDKPTTKRGRGSAVMVKTGFENPFTFIKNSFVSFIYASLGPFPWQLRYLKHLFILPELILWYFALFFAIKGIKKPTRPHTFTLLIFSLLVLGTLSLFLSNYGIVTRLRIPAFISLFCLAPFGFKRLKYIKIPFLNI
ncbi:hypothetical protein KKE19_02110 [Patescibacteria group bacterium]|nr:hypothetical protein [Patescibacteria group bacterium]